MVKRWRVQVSRQVLAHVFPGLEHNRLTPSVRIIWVGSVDFVHTQTLVVLSSSWS